MYKDYIPQSVRELLINWYNLGADGNYDFRIIAHIVYGNQERYPKIREDLSGLVSVGWNAGYEQVYAASGQDQDYVKRRVMGTTETCGPKFWMWDADLIGLVFRYNWAFVVYASARAAISQHTFGTTYLSLRARHVQRPDRVVELVCTGNHWLQIQLAEVDGYIKVGYINPDHNAT